MSNEYAMGEVRPRIPSGYDRLVDYAMKKLENGWLHEVCWGPDADDNAELGWADSPAGLEELFDEEFYAKVAAASYAEIRTFTGWDYAPGEDDGALAGLECVEMNASGPHDFVQQPAGWDLYFAERFPTKLEEFLRWVCARLDQAAPNNAPHQFRVHVGYWADEPRLDNVGGVASFISARKEYSVSTLEFLEGAEHSWPAGRRSKPYPLTSWLPFELDAIERYLTSIASEYPELLPRFQAAHKDGLPQLREIPPLYPTKGPFTLPAAAKDSL